MLGIEAQESISLARCCSLANLKTIAVFFIISDLVLISLLNYAVLKISVVIWSTKKVRKEATNICDACSTPKTLWNVKVFLSVYCLFVFLMENFKYTHQENNISLPPFARIQLQRLSAHGQSCFIYIFHCTLPILFRRSSLIVYHFICK